MAELSIKKTPEEWWPSGLRLLDLEYENSKLLVHQDGLMFEKWKTDIDLLINDEKSHRESQRCEKLSQTSREQERLLQDHIKSLEKELKESKDLLRQTNESLEDFKEKSKAEKERLQERLTIEAEERFVKEREKFKKEREALNKEVDKWKNMKEKLEVEMKEMEKTLRLEENEKFKQQEKEANSEIKSLNKQLQTWKDKHAEAVEDVEGLQRELANKNVVSKTKATQTQKKIASKAVMTGVECATIGIQAEIPTEEVKMLPKKQNKAKTKRVHPSNKDSRSAEHTSDSENGQQSDEELEKNTQNSQEGKNGGLLNAKQKRTRNSQKSVRNEQKKTSDEKDESGSDEECDDLPGDVPTGPQGNVPSVTQDDVSSRTRNDVPVEMEEEVTTDAEKGVPTGAKSNLPTGAQENLPTGVAENQPTGHQAPDNESSKKTVKRVRKRKCNKEPHKIDETNAKKTKSSGKAKGSSEDKPEQYSRGTLGKEKEARARVIQGDNDQQKGPSVSDKTNDTSSNTDKQRKTSEQTNKENTLKDKNGSARGTRPVIANGLSKPSLGDRTRQSSIAEMSSILNGTKRQRTLYNTKDSSLMVSILPIQESFMNSTMSRGNKPNGTLPPSLSAFMRSFIAPKLKKKST